MAIAMRMPTPSALAMASTRWVATTDATPIGIATALAQTATITIRSVFVSTMETMRTLAR